MEKKTRTENALWKNTLEEAGSLVLTHSWERLRQVKHPYRPEHKTNMALAVTIKEAVKAFITLDESLTR